MAQGICEKLCFDKRLPVRCDSAGLKTVTGQSVSENAIEVCKEIGVDISRYRTIDVRALDLADYDAVFTMNVRNKSALIALGANPYKISVLSTEDENLPYVVGDDDINLLRQCRDMLTIAVENALKEI